MKLPNIIGHNGLIEYLEAETGIPEFFFVLIFIILVATLLTVGGSLLINIIIIRPSILYFIGGTLVIPVFRFFYKIGKIAASFKGW